MDPDIREDVRIGEGEAVRDLDAQPTEHFCCHLVRIGDDEEQVALTPRRPVR